MDCHAVNEVSAAHCTPVHYNAYVHDLCTRANSKPEAVMNETLVNPAVCLWGISSCSLNHLRVSAQMVMDTTDISHHIQYTVSHAGKEGIPIHLIAVHFTPLIYLSGNSFEQFSDEDSCRVILTHSPMSH